MKFTPTVTTNLGTALDIILSIFGFPIDCKKVSTGIALIQQALSKDSSPDSELKGLSEQIAVAINTIATNEVSEEDRLAVLREAKASLEKFKENAEKDGKDIKNIFTDNMNSPDNLIKQIFAEHKSLGGEAESCYQNIIRMTVTALCKAENVELFINQNYALVKLMQNDSDFRKLLEDNISKIDDIIAMLVKLIKERCLTESELPKRDTTNIFSYLNENIKLQGRVSEQKRIEEFMLAKKPFTFWSVTGKGGTGKSKFALHIAEKYIERGWVVIWCESTTKYDNIFEKEFIHPTLFIFDYAGFSTKEIQKVLHQGSQKSKKQKIRLLFVERDKYDGNGIESWYSKIFNHRECLKYSDYAYYTESINLGSLDDNSIKILLDNFAKERAKEPEITKNKFSDNEKEQIIDYVRKTLPGRDENLDFADRCLFILFTADACLRGNDYSDWDAETLLSSYVTQYISKLPKVAKLKSHLNLLAIATATGGIDIENNADIPVLSTYIEDFINDFDYKNDVSEGQEFIRCLCEKEKSDSIITPMYPDLVGEYFFISRINNIPENVAKDWVSIFLNEKYKKYFIAFLARSLEDWDLQGNLNDVKDWVLEELQSNPDDKLYLAYLLSALARRYDSKVDYRKAVEYYEKSKAIYEEVLPPNDPYLASTYNDLANAYANNGDFYTAIEYHNKALKIREKELPSNHLDLASTYNNLGVAYGDNGDFYKAIKYYNKALEIRVEVLPSNHPDMASTYNNLGAAYRQKGDLDTAIENYNKALKIREKVLPSNHPDLASTYNNLGAAYRQKGDLDTAIENYNKALKIREKVLPSNHPDLAGSYNNLGVAYSRKGDLDTAIEYYKKALKICEEVLPSNHPYLAGSYNNLGIAYRQKGNLDKAIENYNKALDIYEKVLPANHPYLAMSYNNLGVAYRQKGDLDTAIEYYKKALKIREEVLPSNHPSLASTYNNLGVAYADKGDLDTATEYYNKALDIYEKVLPSNHPDLASTYNNLANAYANKGDLDKAIEYHEKALKIREEVLPSNHPNLAMSYNNLGVAYDDKGVLDKAIELYLKALAIFKIALPNTHPDTIGTYKNIIVAFLEKGDEENAQKYYDEMINFCK